MDLRYPSWKLPVHCRLLDAQLSEEVHRETAYRAQMPSLKNFRLPGLYLRPNPVEDFRCLEGGKGESLMAEIRDSLTSWGTGSLSHYLQCFIHPRWLLGDF